jgi:hypothetical protein
LSNNKSCSNCGATIPADSLFCEQCGQPLGGAPAKPLSYESVTRSYESPPSPPARVSPPSRQRSRIDNRLLLAVVGVAIALIILVAAVATNLAPRVTPSTVTRDAFLEKYLAALKNSLYTDKNYSYSVWEVTWINSTSARLEMTAREISTATAYTVVTTYTVLPTTQDATDYLNAMDKTAYSLHGTQCSSSSSPVRAFLAATGHAPQICTDYMRSVGDNEYYIDQVDNLIAVTD